MSDDDGLLHDRCHIERPHVSGPVTSLLQLRAARIADLEAENAALVRTLVTVSRERDERADMVAIMQTRHGETLERARRAERFAKLWKRLAKALCVRQCGLSRAGDTRVFIAAREAVQRELDKALATVVNLEGKARAIERALGFEERHMTVAQARSVREERDFLREQVDNWDQ